ncbi:MAG: class I SAM-dependent methyltransferase [Alphaproteobacteria bacterium]|nr:class I SAM-dependent methyltransferase [Alphaproteobacteria bacterium]
MEAAEKGQLTRSAADVYDEFFVPSLFQQWAAPVVEAAGVRSGHAVLDVACGTGVLACEAAARTGQEGSVVGLDVNEGMLAVARRTKPDIRWQNGRAEELPFADAAFDAVISQFGLMFFEDRVAALREMWRVLRPGGGLAVAVWDRMDTSPGYAAMEQLLQRLFGDTAALALQAPFNLGDTALLPPLFSEAGIANVQLQTQTGTARFPSLSAWVHTDVKGWTLAGLIDEAQYQVLQNEAQTALAAFVQKDGTVAFDAPAHIVSAVKP